MTISKDIEQNVWWNYTALIAKIEGRSFMLPLHCAEFECTICVIYTTVYFIKDSLINSTGSISEESMHSSFDLFLWQYFSIDLVNGLRLFAVKPLSKL